MIILKKLYVYSWADYIPHEIYEDFEKETGMCAIEDITLLMKKCTQK